MSCNIAYAANGAYSGYVNINTSNNNNISTITNTNAHRYKKYITVVEQRNKIPIGLLAAIINVESAFKPYAININGKTLIANSAAQAVIAIEAALSQNITNIDIGLAQINYRSHKDNFKGLPQMLSPKTNIEYAGKLLNYLFKQHGNWNKAIRYYHSAAPIHHNKYAKKVILALIEEKDGNKRQFLAKNNY